MPILFGQIGGGEAGVILRGDQAWPWREHSGPAETEEYVLDYLFKAFFRGVKEGGATEGVPLQETSPSPCKLFQ
jgi:hypothetical protein